jgi:hypothetical protein
MSSRRKRKERDSDSAYDQCQVSEDENVAIGGTGAGSGLQQGHGLGVGAGHGLGLGHGHGLSQHDLCSSSDPSAATGAAATATAAATTAVTMAAAAAAASVAADPYVAEPGGSSAGPKGSGAAAASTAVPTQVWFRYGELMERVSLDGLEDVADLRVAVKAKLQREFDHLDAAHLKIFRSGRQLAPDNLLSQALAGLGPRQPLTIQAPPSLRWPRDASQRPDAFANSPFARLPNEVISKFFVYLDPRSVRTAAQVCRRFADLTSSNHVWEAVSRARYRPESSAFYDGIDKVCQEAFGGDWKDLCRRCAPLDDKRINSMMDTSQIDEPTQRLLLKGRPFLFTWVVPINLFEVPGAADKLSPNEKTKHCIYSPTFVVRGVRWRLLVFPRSVQNDDKHVSIFLDCQDAPSLEDENSTCKALFSLLLSVYPWRTPLYKVRPLQHHKFTDTEPDWGYASFIRTSEVLTQYIPQGRSAHIRIDVAIYDIEVTRAQPQLVAAAAAAAAAGVAGGAAAI